MTPNAVATRNGTLRNETTLLFNRAASLTNRARAVVGARVFADAHIPSSLFDVELRVSRAIP